MADPSPEAAAYVERLLVDHGEFVEAIQRCAAVQGVRYGAAAANQVHAAHDTSTPGEIVLAAVQQAWGDYCRELGGSPAVLTLDQLAIVADHVDAWR